MLHPYLAMTQEDTAIFARIGRDAYIRHGAARASLRLWSFRADNADAVQMLQRTRASDAFGIRVCEYGYADFEHIVLATE